MTKFDNDDDLIDLIEGIQEEKMIEVASSGPGKSFGELALINDKPRGATIRCRTDVYCGVLHKNNF